VGLSAHHQLLEPEHAKIKFIGMKEGGVEKLKGKKIVNIYHDSAYGKETIPVLDAQAAKYGFQSRIFRSRTRATSSKRSGCRSARSSRLVILRGWA